jgi:hypothetical protein
MPSHFQAIPARPTNQLIMAKPTPVPNGEHLTQCAQETDISVTRARARFRGFRRRGRFVDGWWCWFFVLIRKGRIFCHVTTDSPPTGSFSAAYHPRPCQVKTLPSLSSAPSLPSRAGGRLCKTPSLLVPSNSRPGSNLSSRVSEKLGGRVC